MSRRCEELAIGNTCAIPEKRFQRCPNPVNAFSGHIRRLWHVWIQCCPITNKITNEAFLICQFLESNEFKWRAIGTFLTAFKVRFLTSLNHKWDLFNISIFRWNWDKMRANGDIFTCFSDVSSKIQITDEMSLIFKFLDSNKMKCRENWDIFTCFSHAFYQDFKSQMRSLLIFKFLNETEIKWGQMETFAPAFQMLLQIQITNEISWIFQFLVSNKMKCRENWDIFTHFSDVFNHAFKSQMRSL